MTRDSISHIDWFFEDAIAGMAHMTPEQRGVYITMLNHFWSAKGRLPDNDQTNARLCNCSTRMFKKIKTELLGMQKLGVRDGFIFHERALFALEKAAKVKELARENGAKGGRKFAENLAKSRKNKETGVGAHRFALVFALSGKVRVAHPCFFVFP